MNTIPEQVDANIRQYVGKLQKVKIGRSYPCHHTVWGFVVDANSEWLLVWQFTDFFDDGFTLIRSNSLTNILYGDVEKFWTEMLIKEGIAKELPDPGITVGHTKDIFQQLQKLETAIIVESEDKHSKDEEFYVGRIARVRKTKLKFAKFDALGQWDDKLSDIGFDKITRIQFNTPYTNTYSKYTDGACPFQIRKT